MMKLIKETVLQLLYTKETGESAYESWYDEHDEFHSEYCEAYVLWLENLVTNYMKPVELMTPRTFTRYPWENPVGEVQVKELKIAMAGKARSEFLVDIVPAPEEERKKWRKAALVYFNGNDSVLHLTDIERYANGSIKSGWVENGHWTLKIVDGVAQACSDCGRFVVNSWKIESIVEKDFKSYYGFDDEPSSNESDEPESTVTCNGEDLPF